MEAIALRPRISPGFGFRRSDRLKGLCQIDWVASLFNLFAGIVNHVIRQLIYVRA